MVNKIIAICSFDFSRLDFCLEIEIIDVHEYLFVIENFAIIRLFYLCMQVFTRKLHDALFDSIDRFDKFSFLTNQQQPNFMRAKPGR